jgi:hypothetical protein
MVQSPSGVPFMTTGRPPIESGRVPDNVMALSSWRPNPWPSAATVPVGFPCRRVWVFWQNYVHPIKNYISNGELVLRYADGTQSVVSLVPPYNLDCYFQHFARQGEAVPFGQVSGGPFYYNEKTFAHADVLEVPCQPARSLASLEIRATCSEGALGVLGLTAEAAP